MANQSTSNINQSDLPAMAPMAPPLHQSLLPLNAAPMPPDRSDLISAPLPSIAPLPISSDDYKQTAAPIPPIPKRSKPKGKHDRFLGMIMNMGFKRVVFIKRDNFEMVAQSDRHLDSAEKWRHRIETQRVLNSRQ